MDNSHHFVLLLLVLFHPLRVRPGLIKEVDVTSEIASDTSDPFNVMDMINFYRSPNVPAKRKMQRPKVNGPQRFDDESGCSESESSEDDYGDSEYSDDAPEGHSDGHDDDSGTERCCTTPGSQTEYSDDSD